MKSYNIILLFTFCCLNFQVFLFGQTTQLGLPLGHESPISFFDFSTDNKYVISSAYDGTKLWEASTGKFLQNINNKDAELKFKLFKNSTFNHTLIVDKKKQMIRIWQNDTGQLLKEIKGTKAIFSPNGKTFATYSSDEESSQLWDTASLTLIFKEKGRFIGYGNSDVLFVIDSKLKAFSISTNQLVYSINQTIDQIKSISFLTKEKAFIVLTKENNIIIRNVSDGTIIKTFRFNESIDTIILNDNTAIFGINFYEKDSEFYIWKKNKISPLDFNASKILSIIKNTKNETVSIQIENDALIAYNHNTEKTIYSIPDFYDGECGFTLSPNKNYFLIMPCGSNSAYAPTIGATSYFSMFNSYTGKYITSFYSKVDEIRYASISNNQQFLVSIAHLGKSQILDLKTGQIKHVLDTEYAISGQFSTNNHYLATNSDQRLIDTGSDLGSEILIRPSHWIWKVENGQLISIIEKQYDNYSDKKYEISTSYKDEKIATFSENDGYFSEPLQNFIGHSDTVYLGALSQDYKIVATASCDSTIKLWDTKTGDLYYTFPKKASKVTDLKINVNDRSLFINYEDGTQQTWDISTYKLIRECFFDKNEKEHKKSNETYKVINDSENNILEVYQLSNNTLLHKLIGHKGLITSYQFIPNTNFLVSSSYDGSIIFWDLTTGKQLLRQFILNTKDLIWILPNGYYFASKQAASKLYYINELKTIGFEQLDIKYNRPDKVLEVLNKITGNKDTLLLKAYKNAWEKRIKKLAIDTSRFAQKISIPECDFLNRENITYDQSKEKITLQINAMDSLHLLDRYNIWVNEVPMFGKKGVSIKKMYTNHLNKKLKITLSKGNNKIEVSVINSIGAESYRRPLFVKYNPKKEIKEKLYFVGIGVDKYQEEGHNLKYSVKDIRDLSFQLKKKYGKQIQIDTLFNQNVTISNILAIKNTLQSSNVNDKVIISFSGHGLLSKELDYFLATYNVNFDSPEQNGLPYEELEFLLDGIASRQKLLLIDACHSGEVDKDEIQAISKIEQEKEGLKGLIIIKKTKKVIGLKNSFELMKELFNNVDRNTGTTVISAAAGTQFAQERGDLKNGVFTYCILKQLEDTETMSISTLKKVVSVQVQEMTNGLQQPTYRTETIENNWNIW